MSLVVTQCRFYHRGKQHPKSAEHQGGGTWLFHGACPKQSSSCDKPFQPRINKSYTKVFLIGLEVPESSDSLLFNNGFLIPSFLNH